MGRGHPTWTETRIERLYREGRGRGHGATYRPWLEIDDVSSLGRSRRVWSPKLERTVHLLSDVEYRLFIALEWQCDVTDIREQYPLDRDVTQTVARELGIRHPCYPGTNVPTVMTTDFLVTRLRANKQCFVAFNAKRDEEASNQSSLLKLEIQRCYFERLSVTHHLVYHSQIPKTAVDNIDWIRSAELKDGEAEREPEYFASLCARMAAELAQIPDTSVPLTQYCADFDRRHGAERGTGVRTARMLMAKRVLKPDLALEDLAMRPLSAFSIQRRLSMVST